MGDRRQLRNREERTGPRSQRDALMARLASPCFPGHARLRHDGRHPASRQRLNAPKNDPQGPTIPLIRWSIQEIRRIANRIAQRQIQPAKVIAWSLWRRAHQAAARQAHIGAFSSEAGRAARREDAIKQEPGAFERPKLVGKRSKMKKQL